MHKLFVLKPHEKVIRTVRRYVLTYTKHVFVTIVCFFVAFFFMFWLFRHGLWGQSIFIILLGIGVVSLVRVLVTRSQNVCYITSHRIIDIHRQSIFRCVVSEVPYDQIEDVSGEINGFFGTVFRYGNVHIQTGGGTVKIVIDRIKAPITIQELINTMREKYVHGDTHKEVTIRKVVEIITSASHEEITVLSRALKHRVETLEEEMRL